MPSPIRVRPYQLIRHLVRLGHRVTLVALDADRASGNDAAIAELRSLCEAVHIMAHPRRRALWNCLRALPTPTPLWAAYCYSRPLLNLVRRLIAAETFDVAHGENLRAAFVAPALGGVPCVFDAVDCITELQRQMGKQGAFAARLLAWEEWIKLRRYEPRAYARFQRLTVTTDHEAQALIHLAQEPGIDLPPLSAISNGVDLEYFHASLETAPEPDTLVFSGKLSYRANEDAARFLMAEILPRVRVLRPAARLLLVGSGASSTLRKLGAQVGGVEVTGYIDDIRPYLVRASVAVCPLRIAVGMQNKALEAMAMGRPIVCTPAVARALPGAPLAVAEDAERLARACADLLALPNDQWRRRSEACRTYVEKQHRWEESAQAFVGLYQAALAERNSGRS